MKKTFILFQLILLILSSCKKNSNDEIIYKDELQENVVLIKDETKGKIIKLSGNTLIVKGTSGYARDIQSTQDLLKIGTVLVCEPLPNIAPDGIFNTVIDIQPNTDAQYGAGYNNITLAPATLEDYIKNTEGYNTDKKTFIAEQVQPESGVTSSIGGNSVELIINKQITQTFGSQASVNFKISGTLKFEKDLQLGLKVRNRKIESFKIELVNKDVANVKVEGNLELAAKKEWDLCKIKGSPIKFLIGTIPVWVSPVFTVKFKLDANGKAGFNIDVVKFDKEYSNGIEYSNGSWKEISVPSPTAFTPLQVQLFLEGEAKLNLEASLEGKFYNGLVSIGVNGSLFRKLKNRIQSGEPTKCDWILGAEAGLTIKSSVFSKDLIDFNYNVYQWEFKREIIDLLVAPPFDPTNGLVAYYPFNGNANDESGNGSNGIIQGATLTTDKNGVVNSAYFFNGTSYINGGVQIPSILHLMNSVSISAKIKVVSAADGGRILRAGCNCSQYTGYDFFVSPYGSGYQLLGQFGDGSITSNHLLNFNTWYSVVLTADVSGIRVYVDGQLVASNLNAITPPTASSYNQQPFLIGVKDLQQNNGYLNGSLDQIRIYNRVLTVPEIQSLHTNNL